MKPSPNTEIPYRILGRTGQKVSAIGLGGFHIGARTQRIWALFYCLFFATPQFVRRFPHTNLN